MSEAPRQPRGGDDPADAGLAAIYRQTAPEQPPPHLDDAIRAAARRAAGARPARARLSGWRIPIAVAAVVVVSVSLVTMMQEEGGRRLLEPRSAPVDRSQDTREPVERAAAPTRPSASRDEPEIPAPESLTAQRGTPRPEPQGSPAPSVVEGPAGALATPGGGRVGPETVESAQGRPLQPAPHASGRGDMAAETRDTRRQTELAQGPAPQSALLREYDDQPPQKWLEKIAELRAAGKAGEADELLKAFRKRFPDHPLPAGMK